MNIALYCFLDIVAKWRQKEAQSRDNTLLVPSDFKEIQAATFIL